MNFILKSVVSVIIVTIILCKNSFGNTINFPNSPCPNIFKYTATGNKNIGLITIKDVSFGQTTVEVELSQQGYMEFSDPGQLSLNFNKDKLYEYLEAGIPLTYRLDFPLNDVIPRVTSIKVNGFQICSGPGYNSPKTTMKLEHTLNVHSSGSQLSVPRYNNIQPQEGQMGDSNMPEFLKYSPSFAQKMLLEQSSNHNSQFPFTPKPFNESPLNQPSFHQPSFNQPLFNQQPSFNQPSFNRPSFTQPSYNQRPSTQPSFNQNYYNQASYGLSPNSPSPFSQHSNYQSSYFQFDSSPFNQPTNNFPSFHQPSSNNIPTFNQFLERARLNLAKVSNPQLNQVNSVFSQNPANPFLNNNSVGIDSYRPYGTNGPRNPPPTVAPPPTQAQKPTPSPTVKPIFISPTTNIVTPRPQFEIENRSPQPTPSSSANAPASTDRATFAYINSVCGRENLNFDMTKLNVKGSPISKSRFPWIVALFRKIRDDLKFLCGGSLISTRTVVSAAHCFYLGLESMKPEDILVSMGRHNLTDWMGANNVDADSVILHPDYNPSHISFDADVAIIRIKASLTFTNAIRPICMWQGDNNAQEIVGMSGVIVGWGSDNHRKTTIVPTLVNATVVAEITCIRANDQFVLLTSNRTICAGNLDGSGPCIGDSGNGLMLRNRNKWMLRGTVSAALGTPTGQCLMDEYAIYSDIAMFIEWIKSNMLL